MISSDVTPVFLERKLRRLRFARFSDRGDVRVLLKVLAQAVAEHAHAAAVHDAGCATCR